MDTLLLTVNALGCVVLLALWVAAWLTWLFDGQVRSWIVALSFQRSWLVGVSRSHISDMDPAVLTVWLVAESTAPRKIRDLLSCPVCSSAYIAAVGLIQIAAIAPSDLWLAPLIWAGGAFSGLKTFTKLRK